MTPKQVFQTSLDYTSDSIRKFNYVTDLDLSCTDFRNATATPRTYYQNRSYTGAIYDGRNRLIKSTQRFNRGDIVPVDAEHLDDTLVTSARLGEAYSGLYGGILFPILGHFIFESLSRLWPLLWNSAPSHKQSMPIFYHHWPDLEIASIFRNPLYKVMFEAFGIEQPSLRLIDTPKRFESLIIAEPASAYHLSLNRQMISILNRVVDRTVGMETTTCPTQRVFLSRSQWRSNKRIVNEEALDDMMSRKGFRVLHTERMNPVELLKTLQDSEFVVSTDGSHAHLSAFCREGVRTLLLDTRPVPTQFAISILRDFRTFHVPLFKTAMYKMESGIVDLSLLSDVVDLAIAYC